MANRCLGCSPTLHSSISSTPQLSSFAKRLLSTPSKSTKPPRRSTSRRQRISTERRQRQVTLPTFGDSSSENLNQLLNSFRSTVFLPAYLTRKQGKLVYSQKGASQLQDDVLVKFKNAVVKLNHIDRTKDEPRPSTAGCIRKVFKLLKTPEDWENLLPFLEGLAASGRTILSDEQLLIIREANQIQHIEKILAAAERSRKTGFLLSDEQVVRRLLWKLWEISENQSWKGEAIKNAFRLMNRMFNLLNLGEHPRNIQSAHLDPRRQPDIVSALLHISAMNSVTFHNGEDRNELVARAARDLISVWKHLDASKKTASYRLKKLVPIQKALHLTAQVSHGDAIVGEWLAPATNQVDVLVKNYQSKVQKDLDMVAGGLSTGASTLGEATATLEETEPVNGSKKRWWF
ncbi:MAG: hypothetical protein M1829_004734 [Trizodia sp. TS-e1964]|nr:MAG: hypothetical protein M1829_004734 [Trizodia sp. TS-e1964]